MGLHNMLEKLLGHARVIHFDKRVEGATQGGINWEHFVSTLWNAAASWMSWLSHGFLMSLNRHCRLRVAVDPLRTLWCPIDPILFLPILVSMTRWA